MQKASPAYVIDSTGAAVVSYIYDSWGKLIAATGTLANTVGLNNPFRCRGYVYDTETGWYYLQSRYYNPELCRFVSADVYLSTGQGVLGHNAFAYCRSNPTNRIDASGFYDDELDIYNLIRSNTRAAARTKKLLFWGSCLIGIHFSVFIPSSMTISAGSAVAIKYAVFYENVKAGGPMDYKNRERWEAALPNLPYPGDSGEEEIYQFYGELRSASDIGNINYGAVGAALGIPLEILLWQAGAAQLRDHYGYSMFDSQYHSFLAGPDSCYGDQEDDYESIVLGYNLYMEGYFGG